MTHKTQYMQSRVGTYASNLYVHDIVLKIIKNIHITILIILTVRVTSNRPTVDLESESVKDFPIVSDLTITKDNKRLSDFPARTFVQPSSGLGADNSHVNDFGQFPFTSNSPERSIQRRNSQIEQLKMADMLFRYKSMVTLQYLLVTLLI